MAPINHHPCRAGIQNCTRDPAAKACGLAVPAPINYQNITGAQQTGRMMQQGRIQPRQAQRHSGARDPAHRNRRGNARIEHPTIQKMAKEHSLKTA